MYSAMFHIHAKPIIWNVAVGDLILVITNSRLFVTKLLTHFTNNYLQVLARL